MKVTIIVGPRRCGKLHKAREMAAQRGSCWFEFQPSSGGEKYVHPQLVGKDGKPLIADGSRHVPSAMVFPGAHEFSAEQFMYGAGFAVDNDADIILTTIGTKSVDMFNGRPVWIDKLIVSDLAEVIELHPQTPASKDFARICAVIDGKPCPTA